MPAQCVVCARSGSCRLPSVVDRGVVVKYLGRFEVSQYAAEWMVNGFGLWSGDLFTRANGVLVYKCCADGHRQLRVAVHEVVGGSS